MLHKTSWLIITVIIEIIIIFVIGFIINLFNPTNFKYAYYFGGIIGCIPFAYFLFRFREFDIIKGDAPSKIPINVQALMAYLIPICPLLLFYLILVPLRTDYFISQTVLSLIVAIIGGVIDAIIIFGNFFRKHLTATIFAIIGIVLAYAFSKGNTSAEYGIILFASVGFASIYVVLAALPIFTVVQKRNFIKLAGITSVSFVFILMSFFTNNMASNPSFLLSLNNTAGFLYTSFLTLGLGLFIFSVLAFISTTINLENKKPESDYRGSKTDEIESQHLIPTTKVITNVKDNFSYFLSFLPMWPTESLIEPEGLKSLLKNSTHWWDIEPLKLNILSGAGKEITNDANKMKDIDLLISKLNKLAKQLIVDYIAFYEEMLKHTDDKVLILAVFNTFVGYSKYYWPNIHNKIHTNRGLQNKFTKIMESIRRNKQVKKFRTDLNRAKKFRIMIDGLDSD